MRRNGWVLLGLLAWLAVCAPAVVGQSTPVVRRGTPLYFEHDEQSIAITTRYQFCEDEITDTRCKDVDVIRLQGSLTFQFELPAWVTNGAHIYALRAFGEGEYSDPSNALTLVITGRPLPPTNHRNTPPPSTMTPQSPASPPPPATLSLTPPRPRVQP